MIFFNFVITFRTSDVYLNTTLKHQHKIFRNKRLHVSQLITEV